MSDAELYGLLRLLMGKVLGREEPRGAASEAFILDLELDGTRCLLVLPTLDERHTAIG